MYFYKKTGTTDIVIAEKELDLAGFELLEPNTSDGAGEKHVPVIEADGKAITVKISTVEHPMMEAHYIMFVAIETTIGWQKKFLKPGEKPVCSFVLAEGEELVAASEFCNLHGLWKSEA